jgi:predicted transcriptional regulator
VVHTVALRRLSRRRANAGTVWRKSEKTNYAYRLMEHYDLRSCFLPDLSGLHVRIYQFRELLRLTQPSLSAHLEELQVDPAYVSQWFLSFFAVTCPLPMLFRIYDVVFAEGASETIMRVALSLMRKNESRILACTELEDVMQLLLSRGLWDCYHYNADEFVDDFCGLSHVVSREKLALLEQTYREAQVPPPNAARTSDVATAAQRFLGRLWAVTSSPRSGTLSPSPGLTPPSRPLSMLRRSTSKQSLASTLNSMEASSVSVTSSASTDATTVSRDSSNTDGCSIRESTPTGSKHAATGHGANATESRTLHSQIEDLLTAISEMQRNHAELAIQLQKEREEREEERTAVKSLLDGFKRENAGSDSASATAGIQAEDVTGNALSQLIEGVEERLGSHRAPDSPDPSGLETRSQLREELARTKEHFTIESSKSQDLNRRLDELSQEMQDLKDQLRDSHAHVRNLHQEKQRLEKQAQAMRLRSSGDVSGTEGGGWFSGGGSGFASKGGLREFKLGRSKSTPSSNGVYAERASSMSRSRTEPNIGSPGENDALLHELAQAKTAEAIARQEADEYRQKFETLRKSHRATIETTQGTGSTTANATTGMFGRLTTVVTEGGNKNVPMTPAPTTAPATTTTTTTSTTTTQSGGGFWGWRR